MYPDNYFSLIRIVFIVGGYHRPSQAKFPWNKVLWFWNPFIICSCLVFYSPAEVAMLPETVKVLNHLVEHFGMMVTHMLAIQKCILLYKNWYKLQGIMDVLDSDEFKYEDFGSYNPGRHVNNTRKGCNSFIIFFTTIGTFVPTFKLYDGFVQYLAKGHLIDEGEINCVDIMPYFCWFPFFTDTTQRCLIALIVQTVPMVLYVYIIIGFDLSFCALTLYCRAHFVNIRGAFRTMRQRCLQRLNLPQDYEVFRDDDDQRLGHEMAKEMKKISHHMQTVIEKVDDVESIYTFGILGQMLGSLFALVACLYMISIEPLGSGVFVAEAEYVTAVLIQLGIFCYFGNEVTLAAEELRNGIYESEWYSYTKAVKSSMLINLVRLEKPIQLTIGKYSPLSLSVYLQIIRGSYSFFTFLKQTKETT